MIKPILEPDELSLTDWERWDVSLPRYTSYPTAPHFHPCEETFVQTAVSRFAATQKPLSLYIHIPFCRSMCLFCGCAVQLNRRPERQSEYVDLLLQEIALWGRALAPRTVVEIHWGGGTPTVLTEEEFTKLFQAIQQTFVVSPHAEISIEIDPRTVFPDRGEKLRFLKRLGVTRISFGVQDLDPQVQEAVRRRQTEEMTRRTYFWARESGFQSIHLDLIYGLPMQTEESFATTIAAIAELRPDRIALFSYAHVPWMKAHQKAIPDHTLPSGKKKWAIYLTARRALLKAGYLAMGMDHFALPNDPLARAYQERTMVRNFQGYAATIAADLLGLGVTSIGELSHCYLQNVKTIEAYRNALQARHFPVERGFLLHEEDLRCRFVIQALMCQFEVEKQTFQRQFGVNFDNYFLPERKTLDHWEEEGLLVQEKNRIYATALGQILIRQVASTFDRYLPRSETRYSKL